MRKWAFKDWLNLLEATSLIVGIFFIGFQIKSQSEALRIQTKTMQDNQKINSATFVLKVSDELNKPKYEKIMSAIEDHKSNYKLLHGRFSERLLDEYICTFETLGNLLQDNIVTEEMAYNELGYDLEKAWCNKDVQKFIMNARKADKNTSGPNAFYVGFERLAKYSLSRDKKTCSDMEEE
jgi:hypothetical protein